MFMRRRAALECGYIRLMTVIIYPPDKHPIIYRNIVINYRVLYYKEVHRNMTGFVGGAFNNNVGVILVLFILLVIIACSCGVFGGIGKCC